MLQDPTESADKYDDAEKMNFDDSKMDDNFSKNDDSKMLDSKMTDTKGGKLDSLKFKMNDMAKIDSMYMSKYDAGKYDKKKAQKTAYAYKFGVNNALFPGGLDEKKTGADKFSVMNKAKKSQGHLLEKKNLGKARISQIKDSTLSGITKPAIRRLARRGGVKRISKPIYEEIRNELRLFLESTLRDATTYCEHAKRKTVKPITICQINQG